MENMFQFYNMKKFINKTGTRISNERSMHGFTQTTVNKFKFIVFYSMLLLMFKSK